MESHTIPSQKNQKRTNNDIHIPFINLLPRDMRLFIFHYFKLYDVIDLGMVCKLWRNEISKDNRLFDTYRINTPYSLESELLLRHPAMIENTKRMVIQRPLMLNELRQLKKTIERRPHNFTVEIDMWSASWTKTMIRPNMEMVRSLFEILGESIKKIKISLVHVSDIIEFLQMCAGQDLSDSLVICARASLFLTTTTTYMDYIFERFPRLNKLSLQGIKPMIPQRIGWPLLKSLQSLELDQLSSLTGQLTDLTVLKTVSKLKIQILRENLIVGPKNIGYTHMDFLECFNNLKVLKTSCLLPDTFDHSRFLSFIERLDAFECEFETHKLASGLAFLLSAERLPKIIKINGYEVHNPDTEPTLIEYAHKFKTKFTHSWFRTSDFGIKLIRI